MEIISCYAASNCYTVNFSYVKTLRLHRSKLRLLRGNRLFYFVTGSSSHLGILRSKNVDHRRSSRRVCSVNNHEHVGSSVVSETYNAYVLDGEEGGTQSAQSSSKVSIPSLPDEKDGASVSSRFREWKPKLTVHYETSGSENVDSPSVLFLPGFGVGSYHYEKQMKDLGRNYRTWALDFLGQGMSLPFEDPTLDQDKGMIDGEPNVWGFGDESKTWAKELVFSVDLWRDQVRYFIEEVRESVMLYFSFEKFREGIFFLHSFNRLFMQCYIFPFL